MTGCTCHDDSKSILERSTLWALLIVNLLMFFVEGIAGWWAESTGLLADSLDMFADAAVYGIALYAVGRAPRIKAHAALVSGILQTGFGIGVMVEVARRFVYGSEPLSLTMMIVGSLAFAANLYCLLLIAKHRKGEVHMRASWIFTKNDVINNLGVIVGGVLVGWLGSPLPDLIIGAIIAAIVLQGGLDIIRQAVREMRLEQTS